MILSPKGSMIRGTKESASHHKLRKEDPTTPNLRLLPELLFKMCIFTVSAKVQNRKIGTGKRIIIPIEYTNLHRDHMPNSVLIVFEP